ncbi:MAG TPA: CPBP family intramembrane glutamic endopeptidase [Terracidiphilus sp.]|jgi:hypothetical protein|nr:CPBP family intramembrane glutamic endopeptidase [Terracidiphilus sp.]
MSGIEQADSSGKLEASRATIAPAWHTIVLVAGILALSLAGKLQIANTHHTPNRLVTYAASAGMELLLLAWVALGLWRRQIPFRSLWGTLSRGSRALAADIGVAAMFWIVSLSILGTVSAVWAAAETALSPSHAASAHGLKNPETLRAVGQLAPATGVEMLCWVTLCCMAGTIEEIVFRGYLQKQFTAWAHGKAAWGVVFSALLFGAAHGYQGARNMILLALFGALFSVLAMVRGNLRAGIIAHSWHDLVAGLTFAFLRAHHLV